MRIDNDIHVEEPVVTFSHMLAILSSACDPPFVLFSDLYVGSVDSLRVHTTHVFNIIH